MSTRKDFAGINICVYDPIEGDSGSFGENTTTFGYADSTTAPWYTDAAGTNNNSSLTSHSDKNTLVLLNLHRNAVWGYSSWKQLRVGQNPLTRNQIKNSVYSYAPPCELEEIRNVPVPTSDPASARIRFDNASDPFPIAPATGDTLSIIDADAKELVIAFDTSLSQPLAHLANPSLYSTTGLTTTFTLGIADFYTSTTNTIPGAQLMHRIKAVLMVARDQGYLDVYVAQRNQGSSVFLDVTNKTSGVAGNPPPQGNGKNEYKSGGSITSPTAFTLFPFAGGTPLTVGPASSFMHKKRYCNLEHKTEPMLSSKYAPLQYNFGYMMKDGRMAEFTLKAVLTNECRFFTHDRMTDLFASRPLTTEDYEQAKVMYLNNPLNNSHNPIDSIELIKYRETIYPQESYTFLSRTRQRDKYVSGFWRTKRALRKYHLEREYGYSPIQGNSEYTVYEPQSTPLDPSSWCLDARDAFLTSIAAEIGFDGKSEVGYDGATETGFNRGCSDGSGLLQNSYSQFGFFNQNGTGGGTPQVSKSPTHLKDAPTYYHRHATRYTASLVAPSGLQNIVHDFTPPEVIPDELLFRGDGLFTAHLDRETFTTTPSGIRAYTSAKRPPFYDTYKHYSEFTRLAGQDYSVVPEFNISENLEFYLNAGAVEKNLSIFTVKGSKVGSSTALNSGNSSQKLSPSTELPILKSTADDFYETYSNSDFLKMFDIIETDNKDTIRPSVIKLTCKAIKKFLPYDGFYPSARTTQIADQFYSSYSDVITSENGGSQIWFDRSHQPAETINLASASAWTVGPARIKPINTALFSPGILFNTIKSGLACDWPNMQAQVGTTASHLIDVYAAPGGANQVVSHSGNYTTLVSEVKQQTGTTAPDDYSLVSQAYPGKSEYWTFADPILPSFHNRIPFEALSNPEAHMSNYTIADTEPHPRGNTGLVNSLNGATDNRYKLMMNNFLAEVPRFF